MLLCNCLVFFGIVVGDFFFFFLLITGKIRFKKLYKLCVLTELNPDSSDMTSEEQPEISIVGTQECKFHGYSAC